MARSLLSLALILPLAACDPPAQTYLYKPGATLALLQDDQLSCDLAGRRAVPVNIQTEFTPPTYSELKTLCETPEGGGAQVCTTTGGDEIFPAEARNYDANSDIRAAYVARCIAGKGYQATRIDGCKREDIPADLAPVLKLGVRKPVAGACAVRVNDRLVALLYPGETR